MRGLSLVAEALFAAGARAVHLGIEGLPPLTDPAAARALPSTTIRPSRLMLSTVHLMGTAGLGADPLRAVCDGTGRVYDAADLYVADASLFPGPVGVNPMLTIMALATRGRRCHHRRMDVTSARPSPEYLRLRAPPAA